MNQPTIPHHAFWNPSGRLPKPPESRLRQLQRAHIEKTLPPGDIGLVKMVEEKRKGR